MQIREFNKSDKDYTILARLWDAVWPEHPSHPDEIKESDGRWPEDKVRRRFVIEKDGEPIGYAQSSHLLWMYEEKRFTFFVGVVEEHRNKGIGQALYDHLMHVLRSEYDANEFHAWTTESRPMGMRFAEKHGFKEAQREWESRLDITNFDFSRFNGLAGKIASEGIEITTWAELQAKDPELGFTHKLHKMEQVLEKDVPSPREATGVDYDVWIKHFVGNKDFVPEGYFTAVHNGEFIAVSNLWLNRATPDRIYTGLTAVRREYRRKGIATALKLRAVDYARNAGHKMLLTWNEQNNPMYQINVKLGFVAQPAEIWYQKNLEE